MPPEASLQEQIEALETWLHNMSIHGVRSAPDHFPGDGSAVKFLNCRDHIPADLTGKTVLAIGCNAGFYSLGMKRRGADRVLGIGTREHYLPQARFTADVTGTDAEFRQMPVRQIARLAERTL